MSPHVSIGAPVAIALLKGLTLLLGGAITWFAWSAWRRTGSEALRALAIGIGIIALGGLLGGLVDIFLPIDWRQGVLIESVFTATGFAVLLYSLYVE